MFFAESKKNLQLYFYVRKFHEYRVWKDFYTSKQKVQTISKNEKQADTIMGNFFTSLFSSSKGEESAEDKVKNESKNFDILKYDGVRAQRINKMAYAIKCYTEALNIKEDFETMSFLVAAYTKTNELEKAIEYSDSRFMLYRRPFLPTSQELPLVEFHAVFFV